MTRAEVRRRRGLSGKSEVKERNNMTDISLKEMLEAGVHFGHKRDKWNPKMAPYIFTEKNGVHIFDLAKTKEGLEEAIKFVSKTVASGGTVLFVGTKNQTKNIIKEVAESCDMPYLVDRWPGGMLTNFHTILGRLKYMKDAEEKTEGGQGLTKKEALFLKRELGKLNSVFEGVKEMRQVPQAMFVADIVKEAIAVREAKKLGIPVIGIADTNALPNVEYVIPGNDDAVRSVRYIASKIAEAISANKKSLAEIEAENTKEEEKTETEADEKPAQSEVEGLEKLEMKAEEAVVVKKQKIADKE